jgi:hypothetical protein
MVEMNAGVRIALSPALHVAEVGLVDEEYPEVYEHPVPDSAHDENE